MFRVRKVGERLGQVELGVWDTEKQDWVRDSYGLVKAYTDYDAAEREEARLEGQRQREFRRTHTPEERIESAVESFKRIGFGPIHAGRYERVLRETLQYGPLGFLQRDAERIRDAITKGLPYAPMPTARQQSLIARANQMAQDIANIPIEDARRARQALQRIAREVGVQLQY